jgi:hypothetical protein
MGGLIDMLGHNARPPPRPIDGQGSGSLVVKHGAAGGGGTAAGRGKGSPGAGKGAPPRTGGNPTTVKVNELSVEMVQAIRKEGDCIGHAKGNSSLVPAASSRTTRRQIYGASQRKSRRNRRRRLR